MKAYMQEINEVPLITREEEVELAALIKGGSHEAKNKLIQANLRLVVKIAHDFKGLGLPLLDLISEGNIGLVRAAEKFDPEKGAKFSSYSAWWIKQSMRRALSQKSRTIRIPVASASRVHKIRTAKIELAEKLGRLPTDGEIALRLDLTLRTVAGLKMADLRTFSLQDQIQRGEAGSFEDLIADTNAVTPDKRMAQAESLDRMRSLLHLLDEREQSILTYRFGLNHHPRKTLEEVSELIGRTRERVRQIQIQALRKMRKLIEDDGPDWDNSAEDDEDEIPGIPALSTNNGEVPWDNRRLLGYESKELYFDPTPITKLGLSTRASNAMRNAGLRTVAQLVYKSEGELMHLRAFGDRCLTEVRDALQIRLKELLEAETAEADAGTAQLGEAAEAELEAAAE